MRLFQGMFLRKWCCAVSAALVAALVSLALMEARAGFDFHGGVGRREVGGVLVDTDGVLHNLEVDEARLKSVVAARRGNSQPLADHLKEHVPMRKVSLKELFAAIRKHTETSADDLPEDILFLGGLQRVQYVFVYPDDNDIVLAGPGEGWIINDAAEIVGETTGRPVMHLEDLVIALRSAYSPRPEVISCSIDPRPEGVQQLRAFLAEQARQRVGLGPDPERTIARIEEALGPQTITITGVPDTSRFARIMIGADYQMKRLGMGFEPSQVRGLPSFLDMVRVPDVSQMMPRWWLATHYDPIAVSEDGLAYEIRGQGVKAMTEDELVTDDGRRAGTGQVNPVAKRWADLMTEKFEELSVKDPNFGRLRNCFDLAVVAALFRKHDLPGRANLDIQYALDPDAIYVTVYNPARTVSTQASAVRKGRNWLVSASGGVEVNPWEVIERQEKQPALVEIRDEAQPPAGAGWSWN